MSVWLKQSQWTEWFAWYPVKLRNGRYCWMTKVYRCSVRYREDMDFRTVWFYCDVFDMLRAGYDYGTEH